MSPRMGVLVRTTLLLGLLGYSAFDHTLPNWWWLALVAVLVWTLIDFTSWHREGMGDDD